MKLKYNLILIITTSLVVTFSGCSDNQKQVKQKTKTDSIKLNDNSTKKKVEDDSSSIAILSTEGKLIKNLKYKYIELNANRHSNEPTDYINYIKGYPLADTIVGDCNGDGKPEKAWFKDIGIKAFEDCQQNGTKKSCEGTILFSDKTIKPLKIDYCPMYIFKNEGDLYGDGKDAIGVLPGWFTSACRQYSVFTLKKGRWKLACSPISNTMNMREAGIVLIEKDQTKKGWGVIRESVDSYIFRVKRYNIPEEYIRGSCCQWSNVVEQTIKLN
jgi:hypothetical protein